MALSWRCRTVTVTIWRQTARPRWRSGWTRWNRPYWARWTTGGTDQNLLKVLWVNNTHPPINTCEDASDFLHKINLTGLEHHEFWTIRLSISIVWAPSSLYVINYVLVTLSIMLLIASSSKKTWCHSQNTNNEQFLIGCSPWFLFVWEQIPPSS